MTALEDAQIMLYNALSRDGVEDPFMDGDGTLGMKLRDNTTWYITLSNFKPSETVETVETAPPGDPELAALQEMDARLARMMDSDEIDAKTVKEIIGERRQLLRQITNIKGQSAPGKANSKAGKLAALQDTGKQEW